MKFLQLADVHLGVCPEGILAENIDTFFTMRDTAFAAVCVQAAALHVDAVLIAGDLFDSPTPPLQLFRQAMEVLGRCPCPVVISAGNHDHIHADSPYLTQPLPKNVKVFTNDSLQAFELNRDCVIWGASFCGANASITLNIPQTPHRYRVGLIHGDLFGMSAHNPLTKTEIERSGLTYLAVGHNHRASGLQQAGNTAYSCTGSFMTTHALDTGEKGYSILQLRENQPIKLDFVSAQAPEFAALEVDLSSVPSDTGLQHALMSLIPFGHQRTIATLKLTGERVYEPNLVALQRAMSRVFFQCTVLDQSVVKKPLWRYLQNNDLRGNVSRKFRNKIESARSAEEKERYLLAFRYALAAFDQDAPPQ